MPKLLSMYEHDDRPELQYPGGETAIVDCDVAVVGGGGSGLSAAVRAAELGARVAIIEKMDSLGGNSRLAGGLLSTYSRFQKEAGMPDMTDEYYKRAFRINKYTLDPAIFKRYISNTGKYYEWIVEKGLDQENTRYVMDSVVMVKERTEPGPLKNPSYGPGLMGTSIIKVLENCVRELEIPCYLSTRAEKLLVNESGEVSGLTASGQDKTLQINAGSVILASGGFGGNTELLRRFLPKYFTSDNYISHYCLLSTTGDGIKLAEEIGAEVGRNISVGLGAFAHIPGSYSIQRGVVGNPKTLVANQNGTRFIAEDDMGDGELAIDMQPDGLAYAIFDEALKRPFYDHFVANARFGDPVVSYETYEEDLQRENREGKIRIADTLEEITEFIGAEPEALQKTMDCYNAMCAAGYDSELFKAGEHMTAIKTPPYYAVRMQRNFDVTMGGVSINSNLEAVTPSGEAIPGLYVTGDIASNWMGEDYGPLFSSFAWAMNSGYLAGEEAVKRV